jgi:hypothetical protein
VNNAHLKVAVRFWMDGSGVVNLKFECIVYHALEFDRQVIGTQA